MMVKCDEFRRFTYSIIICTYVYSFQHVIVCRYHACFHGCFDLFKEIESSSKGQQLYMNIPALMTYMHNKSLPMRNYLFLSFVSYLSLRVKLHLSNMNVFWISLGWVKVGLYVTFTKCYMPTVICTVGMWHYNIKI